MRTTVTLEKDAAAAVESLRRREGVGVSEAINRLIRAGLPTTPSGVWYSTRVRAPARCTLTSTSLGSTTSNGVSRL